MASFDGRARWGRATRALVHLSPLAMVLAASAGGGWAGGAWAATSTAAPSAPSPATPPAASPAAQPSPAIANEPGSTSATYGDWVLRCQRIGEGNAARKVCEVAQTIRLPEARDPVAEVAFGRLPVEKALHVTTLLPPNVSFPSSVVVAAGDKGSSIDLQWRRCISGGCFADGAAPDDLIRAWRTQTSAGRMTFKDAGGRDIVLPLSFRGLAQALDALDKV